MGQVRPRADDYYLRIASPPTVRVTPPYPMRVLLVDDDNASRLLCSRILVRDYDCAITEAANGLEGLELLARNRYDCAVIDLMMPVMDGLEMLAALRGDSRLATLPVMVISSIRDADLVRQVIRLGIDGYIAKPLRPAIVAEKFRQFVAGMRANPAPSSREHEDLAPGSRVLVVDGDRDFVHFARNCLGTDYLFLGADSGAAGLRAMLDQAPAVVLLGRELGALSTGLFMRKVRTTPQLQNHRMVLVGGDDRARAEFDADAVVPRTFVPDQFRNAFRAAVVAATPEMRWLRERSGLQRELISASEQVLGMMLGWDMAAQSEPPDVPETDAHAAEVPIYIEGGEYQPLVQLVAGRDTCEAMTKAMLGVDEISDDDAQGTIQEMSNMIAGRVLEALRSNGDPARLGLPRVFPIETEPGARRTALRVAVTGGPLTTPLFVGLRQAVSPQTSDADLLRAW